MKWRLAESRVTVALLGILVGIAAAQLLSRPGEQQAMPSSRLASDSARVTPAPAKSKIDDVGIQITALRSEDSHPRPRPAESDPTLVVSPNAAGIGDIAKSASETLVARFEADASERLALQSEVSRLKTHLIELESRIDSLTAEREELDRPARQETVSSRQVDATTLIASGISSREAHFVAQRWGEQEMARLRLRDQAMREGWLDTERYREYERDLRNGNTSLRNDLNEEQYARVLYSAGRSNQVLVTGVIESSPAQAFGIQPGDIILRYDDTRIFSGDDLRNAIAALEVERSATLEVERGGQSVLVSLPSGPIGVELRGQSVAP